MARHTAHVFKKSWAVTWILFVLTPKILMNYELSRYPPHPTPSLSRFTSGRDSLNLTWGGPFRVFLTRAWSSSVLDLCLLLKMIISPIKQFLLFRFWFLLDKKVSWTLLTWITRLLVAAYRQRPVVLGLSRWLVDLLSSPQPTSQENSISCFRHVQKTLQTCSKRIHREVTKISRRQHLLVCLWLYLMVLN